MACTSDFAAATSDATIAPVAFASIFIDGESCIVPINIYMSEV
jgi:hypothetical protein